ncbi:MAG: lipid-binding SYLF domain-containing protein [Alphaproteobacteria bacterium]
MTKFAKFAAAAALAAGLFAGPAAQAADPQALLDDATQTVRNMNTDRAFEPARDSFRNAKAVLIIPNLVKGGFIWGAEGGNGVMIQREAKAPRGWGSPAFYGLGSASFGLQAGLEKAEVVLLIMSDRALKGLKQGEVKLGAGAGLTVVTVGAGAEAATPANLAGDIIAWTSAKGLYGGLTLSGSVLKPMSDWNNQYYGGTPTLNDILHGKVKNKAASGFKRAVAGVR